MFLRKPHGEAAPNHHNYPAGFPVGGEIIEGQTWWHLARLSPHKATGMDKIPNIILSN